MYCVRVEMSLGMECEPNVLNVQNLDLCVCEAVQEDAVKRQTVMLYFSCINFLVEISCGCKGSVSDLEQQTSVTAYGIILGNNYTLYVKARRFL